MTNLLACLVHENRPVVDDLVANLQVLHPGAPVLLYNGGPETDLLDGLDHLEDVVVHPAPRRQAWGTLHRFALDAMRFALREVPFDTLTVVDSDQLALRGGFEAALAEAVAGRPRLGMLSSAPGRQPSRTRQGPARTMYREGALWRPFLGRLGAADALVHWTFWPATVFTRAGTEALVDLFDTDPQLPGLLRRSKTWATEEVLFPTFLAALGFEIGANVGSLDFVKYRAPYTVEQLRAAARRPDVFWVHPVPRRLDDPLRAFVRDHVGRLGAGGDGLARPAAPPRLAPLPAPMPTLVPTLPILDRVRPVPGWLEDDEADLLIAAASEACRSLPEVKAIVEVGSYCGRSTVALGSVVQALDPEGAVYAIDPHEGEVGAVGLDAHRTAPTFQRFQRTIARAGLRDVVHPIRQRSYEVAWEAPIRLLLVDGLHDYENVARDLRHFEPHLAPGALVAFHDYADYYPGVRQVVDEAVAGGRYRWVGRARSLAVVQRLHEAAQAHAESAAPGAPRVVPQARAEPAPLEHAAGPEADVPLVTCVMLTAGRRAFVPLAVGLFLRQTYEPRELLVVDDGPEPVGDLLPDDPRVRHLRLDGPLRIGTKRNLGAEAARGTVLAHWDDDDWYAPDRLAEQVGGLVASGAALTGVAAPLFWAPAADRAWRYTYPPDGRPWVCGATLCYWAEAWRRRPFRDVQVGEDSLFVWAHDRPEVTGAPPHVFVGIVHAGNTSPKRTAGRRWRSVPTPEVWDRLGDDGAAYRALVAAPHPA